jgi:hypothetical protein
MSKERNDKKRALTKTFVGALARPRGEKGQEQDLQGTHRGPGRVLVKSIGRLKIQLMLYQHLFSKKCHTV